MTQDSKGRKIAYWITTGIAAFLILGGAIFELLAKPEIMDSLASLGYPKYLALILGVAKVSAVIVILAPKLPRLKEWAYAGIAIDLIGAVLSHVATHHSNGDIFTPLLPLSMAMASWWLRPAARKLPDAPA